MSFRSILGLGSGERPKTSEEIAKMREDWLKIFKGIGEDEPLETKEFALSATYGKALGEQGKPLAQLERDKLHSDFELDHLF